jgi:hypothetical protein
MWSVIAGGAVAILGTVRDGRILEALLTGPGSELMLRLLGVQYASILPVIVSLVVMLAVSRLTRSKR